MKREELKEIKKNILKCLTQDFEYGTKKDGTPLKRRRKNQAIFDKNDGYAIWTSTDLNMVMDKVVLGLYFTLNDKREL